MDKCCCIQGREYDGDGNMRGWWENKVCFVNVKYIYINGFKKMKKMLEDGDPKSKFIMLLLLLQFICYDLHSFLTFLQSSGH